MKSGKLFGADSTAVSFVSAAANATTEGISRWRAGIRAASVSIAAVAASVAFAATTTVSVLIDSDNNASTGCTISTANGPFAGVDRVLNTLVVSDTSGYRITSISMQSCVGSSLNAPTVFDASSTPLVRGNGVNGTTAVETYIPRLYLPTEGQKMRVGITTTGADGLVGTDALTLTAGGPILVDGPPLLVIPTLAKMSLALTALLLALSVWFARRRGWHGLQLVFVAAFALSISGQIIAAIVRDGLIVDWQGIPAAAVDPTGDSPEGTDITNLYSTVENGNVFFRIDTVLNAPPVANAQAVIAVVGQSVPITLTGSDYESSPLTFTVITPPTQGVLTGTAPNLTYTPNANATSSDSFTFKANDGLLDSAPATLSIDIKRPPTITSANSTVFIPGQANSFSFTATGVPPATFALSACAPALPASISFTSNGNNTATLAGNPTVGQGGTYVCTLTASNGFGANATQPFTLNVGLPPTFTSAATTTFTVGTAGSFPITTTATPATTSITQAGTLPTGVTFVYNGPGTPLTGTLSGTPAPNTGGSYPITLTAANGIPPNTVQNFTLLVNQAPAITSGNSTTCTVGIACTFTVTTSGFPAPTIAAGGAALPGGMTFVDNANGTGTLSGTPATGTVGSSPYAITFTATNVVSPTAPQAFTLNIIKANTTTTITNAAALGATPTVVGEPYAVNVAVTPAGTGTPSGTVTVSDGAATCTITLPATSCNLTSTTVGAPKAITASYGGDASFNTSSAAAGTTHTVNKAATTTTITNAAALGTATVVGQAYPVTWTVAVNAPGAVGAALTGNVTVSDGSASCTAAVAAGTCNLASSTAGAKSLVATYAGDSSYLTSASTPATPHTVNPAATTTTISNAAALGTATVVGQTYPVTWAVTVNAPGAVGAALTGNVTLSDGSASCTAAVAAGTCSLTSTSAGAKSLTATYAGDSNYLTSASTPATPHTVNPAATTTTISNAAALGTTTVVGQAYPVTWAVTVNAPGAVGAALTGNVTVSEGSASCTAAVATGTCSLTSTSAGAKSLTATYAGDSNYLTSASTPATPHTVGLPATTTTITNAAALGTATVVGQAYPVTWTVAVNAPGAVGAALTGNVTVSDGSASCTAAVAAGTCNLASSTAGAKSLVATYAGDSNYLTSASTPATPHTVNPAATTTTISNAAALGTATVVGQTYPVTWAVTVNAPGAVGAALTGNVTVSEGSASCTAAVATGTCSLTSTSAGAKSLTATYAGDSNYLTSASTPATPHTVNPAATTTTISNAAALGTTTVVGQAYPVTWAVTVNAPGAVGAALTGNVTVSEGSASCTAAVATGTCSLTSTSAGAKSLTATYAGDSNYLTSASTPATPHTVGPPATTTTITNAAALATPSLVNVAYAVNWSVSVNLPGVLGAPLSGNVTVSDGISNCSAVVSAGTCNLTSTTSGNKSLVATYAGDANYLGSASSPATPHDVNQAPTVVVNVNNAFTIGVPGSLVTFTVTGFPAPTLALSGCTLPAGLTFAANQISGTATAGAATVSGCIVTATNVAGTSPTPSFTITVNQAPSITSANNTTFVVGANGSFSVTATGTPAPTFSTASTLPSGVTLGVAGLLSGIPGPGTGGTYPIAIVANNGVPPNASQAFTLTVNQAPTISAISNATFTIGTPGSGTFITTGFPAPALLLSGCTLPPNLTLSGNSISGTAAVGATSVTGCIVTATNAAGSQATAPFAITINQPPFVTLDPVDVTLSAGGTATFTAAAGGTPTPTVQWQVSTDGGGTFNNVPGATSTTLSLIAVTSGQNGNKYRAVFNNGLGGATTTAATLTVNFAPTVITNPLSQTVAPAATVTFTAAASGNPAPTVQWQVSTNGGVSFSDIGGATATTYSFVAAGTDTGKQFRAVFTNSVGGATTLAATLTTVDNPPTANGLTSLPAQASVMITYPAGSLTGSDTEGAVTIATTPDSVCAGCAVTIRADGGFDFTPPPNAAGTTNTFSFTYHVVDSATQSSPPSTVSFTVAGPAIYFVKSAAVGVGNCTLGNECTLSTALTNIGASTNAHIFLSDANTHSAASVTHNSGGRIIGQGVFGASFDAVFGIAAPAQGTLATRPLINQAKPTVNSTITAHNTSHIRGLIVKPAAGANKGLVASGKTGLILSELAIDMTANGATGNALELVNTSGDYTGGGLVITATTGKGITATGGGTVTVQGTGNKVTTTTGTALEVNGSTIGASHMTFESINSGTAASGPTNGILLSSTGTSGRLIVTGTGAAGTGGTVQKSTGAGVSLSNTNGPSLSWMTISGSTGSGINGTSVTGSMLLDRLTVSGNSTLASTNCTPISVCQAGIFFYNLTGSGHTISNSTIFGSAENNVHVENDGANTLGGLTLTGNTIRDNAGLGGLGNGLHIKANGTASMTVSATSNVFAANLSTAIQADAGGTTTAINLTATNNAMHNAGVTSTQGGAGIGMSVNANSTPTLTFNFTGNTIGKNGAADAPLGSTGINISENTTAHSIVTGNITNNTIFGAGAAAVGGGIRVFPAGVTGSLWKVRVDGNTLSNIGAGYGIFVGSGEQAGTGDSDVQAGVINNNVAVLSTAFDAIRVQSRVTSTMCARVTGNTGSHVGGGCANNLAGLGFCGIQVRQANTSTFSLEGGGTNANIFANNPGTPQAENAFAGTITSVATNFCNQIP